MITIGSIGTGLYKQLFIWILISKAGFEIKSVLQSWQRIGSDNTRSSGSHTVMFFLDAKIELLHNGLKQ
ncbi:hypothetical protein [Mucilaginibacter boryungensis]|uniref:Uncharacterized protein n=1 Tax=Mucilaginibacter boryungensis TaxID=768480 RepID=A0ABR9XHG9_9SPHI|nr:hypothetical protein [Mucilaginibacter boryungensis]MBE9666827.1 hypothetical protein [Mucilaginibacter boryungensis]